MWLELSFLNLSSTFNRQIPLLVIQRGLIKFTLGPCTSFLQHFWLEKKKNEKTQANP